MVDPGLRRGRLAGDPEVQQFAGSIARLHVAGQSNSTPQAKGGYILTWQHLYQVLHFVCELRRLGYRSHRRWKSSSIHVAIF
jgi:hypothetical protein